MHCRFVSAAAILLGLCAALATGPASGQEPVPVKSTTRSRTLPGVKPDGAILLPNQWSLRPVGKQLALGDFPVNIALHPGGTWLAILHAGYGDHEILIVDLERQKTTSRVTIDQSFYGLRFSPDGRTLFASGGEFEVVHAFQFEDGFLF